MHILPTTNLTSNPAHLLDAALDYAARGWSIIPTVGKRAAALWKPFKRSPANEQTLRRMFARKGITGLAVILGSASDGLCCRDYDDADAYHRWAANYPDLASTLPTVQTSRGFHVYHRGGDGYANLGDGEYRADAGHICVLPPSAHPGGHNYCWIIHLLDGDLPTVDPVKAGLLTQVDTEQTQASPLIPRTGTQAHAADSLHVSDAGIEAAILATLPTGPGQRNRRLFELARRIKGIMPGASLDAMEGIVRAWHTRALPNITTKDWLTTWIDFRTAWAKVRKPAGATMAAIVATAKAQMPEDADAIAKLVTLCQALQAHHGNGRAWPLSCRVAANKIGVGHDTAARLLKMLAIEGTIELVTPAGPKGSKRAAEYRLLKGD